MFCISFCVFRFRYMLLCWIKLLFHSLYLVCASLPVFVFSLCSFFILWFCFMLSVSFFVFGLRFFFHSLVLAYAFHFILCIWCMLLFHSLVLAYAFHFSLCIWFILLFHSFILLYAFRFILCIWFTLLLHSLVLAYTFHFILCIWFMLLFVIGLCFSLSVFVFGLCSFLFFNFNSCEHFILVGLGFPSKLLYPSYYFSFSFFIWSFISSLNFSDHRFCFLFTFYSSIVLC